MNLLKGTKKNISGYFKSLKDRSSRDATVPVPQKGAQETTENPTGGSPSKGKQFENKSFDQQDFPNLEKRKLPRLTKAQSAKSLPLVSSKGTTKPMPVIVVTDIGADIDDTLALFVLLGATDAIKIVAVVTSVNNGLHRGAVTRGFLRVLGIDDDDVEILPSVDGCIAGCFIPESFPSTSEASLGKLAETPRRIYEICKEHKDTGVFLYGIASLSPIAAAMKIDANEDGVMKQAIKHVYLQGNVDLIKTEEGKQIVTSDPVECINKVVRIAPNPDAYNFKNDMDAAAHVFDYLQSTTPFTFLGKHAAYRVPIRKGDFSTWTHRISAAWKDTMELNGSLKIPNPPDLLHTAKRQMKTFRSKNPVKFDQIYKVPGELSPEEMEAFHWFDDLPTEYVCSHPYDPLLGLVMIIDVREKQNLGLRTKLSTSDPILDSGKKKKEAYMFDKFCCKNENGDSHIILGNIPCRHSIPDPNLVHDVLVKHISQGLVCHSALHK